MPRDHRPAKSLRVLLSPPDPALAVLLGLQPDLEVVADPLTGRPEVALVAEASQVGAVLAEAPDCRVLLLTGSAPPGLLRAALAAGASGMVLRDGPVADLAAAIRRASTGETVVDPGLAP
ncbi:DNA-binding response regulator [Streptomyces antimicrobicus]|uniref:DNA-binding response regulator n=1 Tax=Streptomyces antimicrobicus TaxID=2883108 RepID=A0ABS8BC96_9ACTN|nr:DNA-binding response regulator [Streptomyces antimicrobicus]MCB5182153.1 DNA-binding response regulator [Streptomyces antimicrobicus]